MPKYSIISSLKRREWLEEHERGTALDVIARGAKRDQRTVKSNVERARLERDFQVAQREQLREALRSHQEDMLALLGRLMQAAQMSEQNIGLLVAPDFGLEDLLSAEDLAGYSQVPLGPTLVAPEVFPGAPFLSSSTQEGALSAVSVLRDADGPNQAILAEEGSILWQGVKEHIGSREPLWRLISHWKQALLEDCQGKASLNRAVRIRSEEEFGIPVLWGTGHPGPHLAAPLVRWASAAVTRILRRPRLTDR